jgi:hypothetical protein
MVQGYVSHRVRVGSLAHIATPEPLGWHDSEDIQSRVAVPR